MLALVVVDVAKRGGPGARPRLPRPRRERGAAVYERLGAVREELARLSLAV